MMVRDFIVGADTSYLLERPAQPAPSRMETCCVELATWLVEAVEPRLQELLIWIAVFGHSK